MTLLEAIQSRHSVRKFIDKPIEENLVHILQEKVNEVNIEGNLHIQLVTNEPKAFKGKMAYGTFSGVRFVRITLSEPPTGKRKQYDAQGEELKYGRME